MTADDVLRELRARVAVAPRYDPAIFFKREPGDYGAGDQFLGLRVPAVRAVAKQFSALPEPELCALMASPFHEARFCGLAILTRRFEKARCVEARAQWWALYTELLAAGGVNNWDLVDVSAPVMGQYLVGRPDAAASIHALIRHPDLWHQRVGVLLTWAFIKRKELDLTFSVSEQLLEHPHDLIHKACGWMLREAGKRNLEALRGFLDAHAPRMPRTMLRYAIEKMEPQERRHWMT